MWVELPPSVCHGGLHSCPEVQPLPCRMGAGGERGRQWRVGIAVGNGWFLSRRKMELSSGKLARFADGSAVVQVINNNNN